MSAPADASLKRTPLYNLHVALGAKMVPFAGYEMPVQYPLGVLKEHLWTREQAGLFDVSHMGQAHLTAEDGKHETVARALEALVPADIVALKPGQQRYTQLLNDDGGIIDDLMVTRPPCLRRRPPVRRRQRRLQGHRLRPHRRAAAGRRAFSSAQDDRGLLALQGPGAAAVLAKHRAQGRRARLHAGRVDAGRRLRLPRLALGLHRRGRLRDLGRRPTMPSSLRACSPADPAVQPIGLGARDSLRLEAGLCLYGHDIDETTSPVEAALVWSMQKRRRTRAASPAPRASSRSWPTARRACASASSPRAARRPAKAPRS